MMTLIKGGMVIDPGNITGMFDILVKDKKIYKIIDPGDKTDFLKSEVQVIDASGMVVVPGLIDMHVHLREPGQEYKETIRTGCMAAAAGGFTAVCPMPNTEPVNDNRQITEYIIKKAGIEDAPRVYPVAAISMGLKGKDFCEYGELKDSGAIALSDDGNPVSNSNFMRRAMEYAKGFGLLIISHCEDLSLAAQGVMNEGHVATHMGLEGIPNAAESIMVMRDIALSELTGAYLHIAHVSTTESVNAVRQAKQRGVLVTAETAPHYFTLTHEAVKGYNTNAKMNPPLRSAADREAVRQGLADGTIDVIATDHAPHSSIEKEVEFDKAANGIIGLETSLPLGLKLVKDGVLALPELIEKMSLNPAKILGVKRGIKAELPADITIIDTRKNFTVDAKKFKSKSRNTPFDGWKLQGKAVLTMVEGTVIFNEPISKRPLSPDLCVRKKF